MRSAPTMPASLLAISWSLVRMACSHKSANVTGYKVYFEVTKKTAYMGKGVLVVVRVQ